MGEGIVFVLMLVLMLGAIFLIDAGLVCLFCWAFSLTFSWKVAFGVFLILRIIALIKHND